MHIWAHLMTGMFSCFPCTPKGPNIFSQLELPVHRICQLRKHLVGCKSLSFFVRKMGRENKKTNIFYIILNQYYWCLITGGPEVGADRADLEARRMPGRVSSTIHQNLHHASQQKFPGKRQKRPPSPFGPILDHYKCVPCPQPHICWMFLVRRVSNT